MTYRRNYLNSDVVAKSYNRLKSLYNAGHRVVVANSGGKDSTVITELCVMAATDADALPVEVEVRDEEVAFPGTYEYLERLAERPEVSFNHIVQKMPVINVFNRHNPYWYTFDPQLNPDEWVRKPPSYAYEIPEKEIRNVITG